MKAVTKLWDALLAADQIVPLTAVDHFGHPVGNRDVADQRRELQSVQRSLRGSKVVTRSSGKVADGLLSRGSLVRIHHGSLSLAVQGLQQWFAAPVRGDRFVSRGSASAVARAGSARGRRSPRRTSRSPPARNRGSRWPRLAAQALRRRSPSRAHRASAVRGASRIPRRRIRPA